MKFRIASLPTLWSAELSSTGKIFLSRTSSWRPFFKSSTGSVPLSKNSCISSSSPSASEDLFERAERALEARQLAVHAVQHERARLIVLRGVIPGSFGHHLHARGRVHHDQRGVGGD